MNANQTVTSREYKLMLNAGRFVDRPQGIRTFWRLAKFLLTRQGLHFDRQLEEQDDTLRRETYYVDTPSFALRQRGFVLRLREEEKKKSPFKVTLKYRSSDRYQSAVQDCQSSEEEKTKFEEDIIPPFASKFAKSISFRKKKRLPRLATIEDAVDLFPGLEPLNIAPGTPLQIVNAFRAQEVVHWVGQIRFIDEPVVKCAMSFWYLEDEAKELPLVAEFSFDYDLTDKDKLPGDTLEQYPIALVQESSRFFRALQKQTGWMNLGATTKTAYAYNAF